MEEIEIVYDNVWDFLITYGEVYVLRASYVRPGKYVCRHKNEERECTVDNVILAQPVPLTYLWLERDRGDKPYGDEICVYC